MIPHHGIGASFSMRLLRAFLCLVLSLVAVTVAAPVHLQAAQNQPSTVANRPTKYLFFNLVPLSNYDVQKNSSAFLSQDATGAGALVFNDVSNSGDQLVILPNGVNPTPPSAPTGLAAVGDDLGCFAASWNANPESNITGYTIYWGTTSSVYNDSLEVPNVTNRTVCGLTSGTYYVALRARNGFGLSSPLSAEVTADVSTGSTQGPTPPQNVQASETSPGCVTVTWAANSEPDIAGYWVYYGSTSLQYSDSVDAGTNTSREICGFTTGTQYFAVRAYNDSDEFSGYSTERSVDVVGPDTTPPALTQANPAPDQTQVALDTPIFFRLGDTQSGVDTNSVSVTVDGSPVTDIRFFGDASDYAVLCFLSSQLPANTTIAVQVSAADLASSPNTLNDNWSFTTGSNADTDAPIVCCSSPANGAKGIDPMAPISFDVSDAGSGVDLANIEFLVNGTPVPFTVDGGNSSATITYPNSQGFAGGSTVDVSINVCDLSLALNCSSLDFSFDVASGLGPAAADAGAIVPNGYWVGDPTRPLEIQNLPNGWGVRIFDTSGLEVRYYQNSTGTEIDWTWDFENSGGRRVARSLYLVRVVDDGGKVKNSGRFLVQLD